MNQSHTATRRRGRPTGTEDGALRRHILSAAETLFSQQGYAATSLRAIGEAAEVNPALVNYHFGGKLGLLEAVFAEALEPLAAALQELIEADSAPPVALLDLLQGLGRSHPTLLPLLVREALLPGGAMHEQFTRNYAPRLGGMFPALLAREQQRGTLHADADPQALTLLLLSMGVFPFVGAVLGKKILGLDLEDGGAERLAAEAKRLLAGGVTP
jgi:AcrR family transcriptional regulator